MSKAYINAISYITPKNQLSNLDLAKEFPEWSAEKVADKLGIEKRFIASNIESTSHLAIKASEKLFKNNDIDRSIIDFVILCTQSPDYALPTTACIIQDKLNLKKSCGAFDFNLGCSGYIYGLAIAKGFIETNIAKNILFITSETYSKFLSKDDKSNRTIFGDAASATLISDNGIAKIKDFVLGSDGSGAENLIVRNSGSLYNESYNNCLFMNGPEIFTFTLKSVPNLIESVLLKHNLEKENIDLFIFHQANKFMLNHLRKKIKIDQDKFYVFMSQVGNTVSSTIPIALYHAINDNKIKKGDKVVLAGFGVGYSWGSTIIEF